MVRYKPVPQQGTPRLEWMKVYSADKESHPSGTDSVSFPIAYFKAINILVLENVVD